MGYWVGFLLAVSSCAFGFVGKNNTEAKLNFSHFVDWNSTVKPTKEEAKEHIDNQLLHLYGPMSVATAYGVPKGEHVTKITKLEKQDDGYRIRYDYEGTIQVKKGPRTKYTVTLPRSPDEEFIYAAGLNKKEVNLCTDDHYNSYDDFWYFWNPRMPKCPLEEGKHYDLVTGDLERIPNTKLSYPEYSRLVNPKTQTIPIYVFFGKDDEDQNDNPMTSKDLNAKTYRAFRRDLIKLGFPEPRSLDQEEIETVLNRQPIVKPFAEVTELEAERATLRIVLYFGNTGIDENSDAFHYFYKTANEQAAVMIYDGHSGLGGHLDPEAIEERHGFKMKMARNRYQIFFFNSCTSYSYYNSLYFYRKAKRSVRDQTRNLDILTQGLAAEFDVHSKSNLALIKAVGLWAKNKKAPSYQKLADQMDQNSLFGINGDEDNPTEAGLE